MAPQSGGVSSQAQLFRGRVTDTHVQLLPTNSNLHVQVYVLVLSTRCKGSAVTHTVVFVLEKFRKYVQAADIVGKI